MIPFTNEVCLLSGCRGVSRLSTTTDVYGLSNGKFQTKQPCVAFRNTKNYEKHTYKSDQMSLQMSAALSCVALAVHGAVAEPLTQGAFDAPGGRITQLRAAVECRGAKG